MPDLITPLPAVGVHLPAVDRRRSLPEAVYESLSDGIISGLIPPGTRLREVQVAQQLGVSATPVREALRRLEWDGLTEVVSRRGAVVAMFRADEVEDLFDIREIVEVAAMGRVADSGPHDWSTVDELQAELLRAGNAGDQPLFGRLDADLHRALTSLAGNPALDQMIEPVYRKIQAARARAAIQLDASRLMVSHRAHTAIIKSLKRGDRAAAEKASLEHIRSARTAVIIALHELG